MIIKEIEHAKLYCIAFKEKPLADVKTCLGLLNKEERDRANAFRKRKDRDNYILSHGYLRILLSSYFPTILPASWEFVYNAYGKPSLSSKHQKRLFFNLSHTKHYVAFIFSEVAICGIDIEEEMPIVIDEAMRKLILSQEEEKMYVQSKEKQRTFYQLWTLKEAYVKAIGSGLQQSPCEIDFAFIKNIVSKKSQIYRKDSYMCGTFFLAKHLYLSYAVGKL